MAAILDLSILVNHSFFHLNAFNLAYIGFWDQRVSWFCPFSCETENEATSAILVKLSMLIKTYFQLNA